MACEIWNLISLSVEILHETWENLFYSISYKKCRLKCFRKVVAFLPHHLKFTLCFNSFENFKKK